MNRISQRSNFEGGVGLGMKPAPKFLKAGDVVTPGIDGLGEQRQKVVAFK
jgi:2-keto-4-pentenoate hydratase/2-oxohepta-3-ene-1,7-dioic acid hydratase in catechol pathway